MKEESKELLIKEFETSWQQLFNIDNRRGVFFNYFNLAFFAVLTFSIEMWVGVDSLNLSTALTVSGIYGFLIIMSNAVVKILESERAANVRYRKKINLIREIILSNDDDPQISMYLERKEIGIKTFSSEGDQIDKIGGTLLPIYFLLKLERIALGILIGLIWVVYVLG